MGVKYQIPYRSHADIPFRVDILLDSYVGDTIVLRGVSEQACVIDYEPDNTDDPYSEYIQSSATLSVYNQLNIDIVELQNAQDRDFKVEVYRNADTPAPNLFNVADPDVTLGNFIEYNTGNLHVNAAYNATGFMPVIAGESYEFSYKHQIAWYDEAKVYISGSNSTDTNPIQLAPAGAHYLRATVVLASWATFSVRDIILGDLIWAGFLIPDGIQNPMKAVPTVTFNCTDGLSLLADMPFVYADNLPGTTATASRCPMNFIRLILFNHNNLGLSLPITWTNTLQCTAFNDEMFTESVQWGQLGEAWSSYQSDNPSDPSGGLVLKTCDYILRGIVKSIQGRLMQSNGKWIIRRVNDIVSGSFESHTIAADQDIMVLVTETIDVNKVIGTAGYPFINEDQLTTVRKGVKSCKVTYNATVRENILPNGNQDLSNSLTNKPYYWYTLFYPSTDYQTVASIDGRIGNGTELTNFSGFGTSSYYYPTKTDGTYGYLPIDAFALIKRFSLGFTFSPSNDGFPVDGSGFIDWAGSDPLHIIIQYQMGATTYWLNENGYWVTTNTEISISVPGMKPFDIATVDFNRGKGIILPQPPAELEAGDVCELLYRLQLNDGQKFTVDYIYITTDENFDVFESTYESENTATDERELEISSSFGGYMLSNYMTYWEQSDTECFYTDGVYTGTLTGMTANAIMRFLYKSSEIYNGSMYIGSNNWTMDEIYTIDSLTGKKFLPLAASYNTETGIVNNLIAIECRSDDIVLNEKHFGTNDSILSN
jgi:hypothetical protein